MSDEEFKDNRYEIKRNRDLSFWCLNLNNILCHFTGANSPTVKVL